MKRNGYLKASLGAYPHSSFLLVPQLGGKSVDINWDAITDWWDSLPSFLHPPTFIHQQKKHWPITLVDLQWDGVGRFYYLSKMKTSWFKMEFFCAMFLESLRHGNIVPLVFWNKICEETLVHSSVQCPECLLLFFIHSFALSGQLLPS